MNPLHPAHGRTAASWHRMAAIWQRRQNGEPFPAIAADYAITATRARQIANEADDLIDSGLLTAQEMSAAVDGSTRTYD